MATDKEPLARELGAHHYLDSTAVDVAQELQKLGGAKVVLATVTAPQAMAATLGGLKPRGQLVVVGASAEPMPVAAVRPHPRLDRGAGPRVRYRPGLRGRHALQRPHPRPPDGPDHAARAGQEAYDAMRAGDARFRMVLTTGR